MPPARESLDLANAVCCRLHRWPLHLDKTLLGLPWRPHDAAPSVRARIEAEKAFRRGETSTLAERGAEKLLELALRHGTTACAPMWTSTT